MTGPFVVNREVAWDQGRITRRGVVESTWNHGHTAMVRVSPTEVMVVKSSQVGHLADTLQIDVDLPAVEMLAKDILAGRARNDSVTAQLNLLAAAVVVLRQGKETP